jgi:F-type H+-transporting ATPase subunit delta
MAENLTLARPYAEAAFQLACAGGSGALQTWSEGLAQLAAVTSGDELLACIGNPQFTPDQLSALCLDVAGKGLNEEQKNFVRVLVENKRLTVLSEITETFNDLRNAHEGVKDAQITSAFPIEANVLGEVVTALERKFGCKIKTSVSIDPKLIGGVRIAVGDEVIDASVRGKLAAMATALKN